MDVPPLMPKFYECPVINSWLTKLMQTQSMVQKKMVPVYFPQYLANLAQPIGI